MHTPPQLSLPPPVRGRERCASVVSVAASVMAIVGVFLVGALLMPVTMDVTARDYVCAACTGRCDNGDCAACTCLMVRRGCADPTATCWNETYTTPPLTRVARSDALCDVRDASVPHGCGLPS